jgi:hypothetical protein
MVRETRLGSRQKVQDRLVVLRHLAAALVGRFTGGFNFVIGPVAERAK